MTCTFLHSKLFIFRNFITNYCSVLTEGSNDPVVQVTAEDDAVRQIGLQMPKDMVQYLHF
jgi:hypothetical protein